MSLTTIFVSALKFLLVFVFVNIRWAMGGIAICAYWQGGIAPWMAICGVLWFVYEAFRSAYIAGRPMERRLPGTFRRGIYR